MDKVFNYPNAVVHIVIPEDYSKATIHKATEDFMRKVIKNEIEKEIQNGNNNKTRTIKEE